MTLPEPVAADRAATAVGLLLGLLPSNEREQWDSEPDPDGGVRLAREPVGETLLFVDVTPLGRFHLVWFDAARRRHVRYFSCHEDCAEVVVDMVLACGRTHLEPAPRSTAGAAS